MMTQKSTSSTHPLGTRIARFNLLVIFLAACAAPSESVMLPPAIVADSATSAVRWQPARLVNGSACVFFVRPPAPLKSLSGTWMGHTLSFGFDPQQRTWFALAGVSLETRPATYTLSLKGITTGGSPITLSRPVPVMRMTYPSIALRVPGKYTAPDPATQARIEKERELKEEVFAELSPQRLWAGNFTPPVATQTSDRFGTQRKFNRIVKSVHQGLDYHAQTGTPVAAANGGKVLLARDLFYEGNCVVLDHGQGLLTLYMHFSEFKVHEGDTVTRGQIIGLSGGTGRATGPHMHIGVRWQGVYLDPATLLRLKMPAAM